MRRAGTVGALLSVLGILVLGQPVTAAATTNEFANPSWTQLPAASAYNTTPSCPPTEANDWDCQVPQSSWPPADPSNPERYLNSAYWPAEKRPDIEMYAIQKYGYSYQNCSAKLPHYCFLVDAKAVGYPVTHTPQVGDLWLAPGECLGWGGSGAALAPGCTDNANDWYLGYVDQVFPDGSFIQSWGGSDTPADSGLAETWFSAAMDPYTDFIGLMAPGSPQPGSGGSGRGGSGGGSKCVVPQLRHMTLARARRALRAADCRLARVRRPRHAGRHRVLRVVSQSPAAGTRHPAGHRVGVRVGP